MKNTKNIIATLVLAAAPFTVSAATLGSSYSAFIFDNATVKGSSINGGIATGGSASFTSVSVNGSTADASRYDVVTGGALSFNDGSISKGSAIAGGAAETSRYNAYGSVYSNVGNARVSSIVDFTDEIALLTKSSAYWGSLESTGTAEYKWGGYLLSGTDCDLNVFNLDAKLLDAVSYMNLTVPTGSTVLLNVFGENAGLTNMGFSGLPDAANVIFNFVDATSLTITGVSVPGTVIAPHANVNFLSGDMVGQLIAKSLTSSYGTSFNGKAFAGALSGPSIIDPAVDPGAAVPEPQTYVMAAAGLLAIGFFRRKK